MNTRKLALIASLMLLLTLALMLPAYAQETTPEPTADAIAPVGIDVTTEPNADGEVDVAVDTTIIEVTEQATAEATAEVAGAGSAMVEEQPVAGVAETHSDDTLRGASLLVLLVGLGAVGVIGFITYVRQGSTPSGK